MRQYLLLLALVLVACPPANSPSPSPTPTPTPDSELCGQMCQHIGPKAQGGLGCPEGDPVYDSDLPGPRGVPNKSCELFCKDQQTNGVFINPRCVMQVTACDQIETARQRTCK